jgi:multiple sugar transport system permease protein
MAGPQEDVNSSPVGSGTIARPINRTAAFLEQLAVLPEDAIARIVLLMPGVLVVLLLSIFPLIISLALAFSTVQFVKGGVQVHFVGLDNFVGLFSGLDRAHLLGTWQTIPWYGWAILILFALLMGYLLYKYVTRRSRSLFGLFIRLVAIVFASALAFLSVATLTGGETNVPGTLVVTLVFVFVGVFAEYFLGLGLALLVTQDLPGKRFFRVIFLLPMMITPVGVGFLFRMMADTIKGPFAPFLDALGLLNYSWASTGFGARAAVLIGDIWQWTPFMFIILLAALEATSRDQIEAALVDGASSSEMFRWIILPQIMPVSTTLILIRMIEAFKIIDLPNILTGGGPGTATESLTFHAYNLWRTTDLGASAAVSYMLLFVVTFCAVVFVNSIRRRLVEAVG